MDCATCPAAGDPEALFDFAYSLHAGSCTTGYGTAFHTWSDETRIYSRSYYVLEAPMGVIYVADSRRPD